MSEDSAAELRDILGPIVNVSTPRDYHTYAWGSYEKLNACVREMLKNRFGCTMLVLDYPSTKTSETENWEISERALIDAAATTGQRAVIVATLPETLPEDVRTRLLEAGIAPMQGLEECLFAIRAAAVIGQAQGNADKILPVQQPEPICGWIV